MLSARLNDEARDMTFSLAGVNDIFARRRNPTDSLARAQEASDCGRVPQRRSRRARESNLLARRRYRYGESASRQCVSGTHVPFGPRGSRSMFLLFASRAPPVLSKSRLRQTGYRGDIPVAAHPAVHSDAELSPRSGYKGN